MTPIIEVKNLSKKYHIGESQPYVTLRDTIAGFITNPLNKLKEGLQKDEFWALKDINFSVEPGEVVGIIGRNGAGKSTLLKILSRITPPSTGEITLRGRVGSLLEVGTGFQQELTGRENIYLNGAILGMTQREIKRKFDEIVDFAEVEKFIDTPVKHYSSGMYMRLAFSIAAHLDPEILIVDEVLAVGDAEFQDKCLGKMNQVSKEEGRTVLFVSHNISAIQSLCSKVMLLNQGKLINYGDSRDLIKKYHSLNKKGYKTAVSNDDLEITKIMLDPSYLKSGQKLSINLKVKSKKIITINDLSIVLSNGATRVALLDFRKKYPYKLDKNKTLSILSDISSIPLVDGQYEVMLYVRYNHDIEVHLPNLCQLHILPLESKLEVVKYDAINRGIFEPDYSFEAKIL